MVLQNPVFTKLFRDGVRHIDYVLVIPDDGDEHIERLRINFLIHAIKIGLEVEVEQGVMDIHRDLLFIKIHAPDHVIEEYGSYFGVRKYFKDTHIDFINVNRNCWGLFEAIFNCRQRRPEKEWIKLVRRQYPGPKDFSTLERSIIVNRILMTLPFGPYDNYFSMCRLLKKNILLDAYALHDGPYFLTRDQDASKVNARQVLYFNWVGIRNWLATQPSFLIQEYMGERISFYFTFFEYYIFYLILAAIAGIITIILELFDNTDDIVTREVCREDLTNSAVEYICPVCKDFKVCPIRKKTSYCFNVLLLNLLDSPFTVHLSIFTSVWAIIFICYWLRKENHLSWMWEIDQNQLKNIKRPEYYYEYEGRKTPKRSQWTGIIRQYADIKERAIKYGITFLITLLCLGVIFAMMVSLLAFKIWSLSFLAPEVDKKTSEYTIMAVLAVINVFFVIVLELIVCYFAHKLTDKENHRTQWSYERALVYRLSGPSIAFSVAILLFFAFLRGYVYSRPHDMSRWVLPLQIGMLNCGPISCLDEVWILMCALLFFKEVLYKGASFFFTHRCYTDYNQGKWVNSNVPCWEKEYRLGTITEDLIIHKYKSLAVQFGLVTMFASAFPLGAALALYMNLLQIRRDAKVFLLKYRRPIMYKSSGIGAWRYVFLIVVYASCVTNALSIAFTTRGIIRRIYLDNGWHVFDYMFLEYSMSEFITGSYLNITENEQKMAADNPKKTFEEYTGPKPNTCFFPGFQRITGRKYIHTFENWYTKYIEFSFVFAFQHLVVIMVLALHYILPTQDCDIRQTKSLEQKIKNKYYYTHDVPGKTKTVYF